VCSRLTLTAACFDSAEREGALLCCEGLALLEAFRGQIDAARATFQAAAEDRQPSGRLLREWALFEKRQGRLQVLTTTCNASHALLFRCRCGTDGRPSCLDSCASIFHGLHDATCRKRLTCLPRHLLRTPATSAPGSLLRCWSGGGATSQRSVATVCVQVAISDIFGLWAIQGSTR
jgi:hypothetical protein